MIGTVLSGRYRLEAKLGSGGMSTVYLARDETLDRPVAVKVMHREMSEQADQLERFRQEARAVAKLSHPNVVSVIDAGEDGGHPYIVFEYVKGETLKQRIGRVGALDTQEAIAYAIEVARGLSVAHARNMVHRDIKPQNVLIDEEGRAKLTDFGISRQLEQDGVTATGRVLGTTDYVAPEQAMGKGVDPRSDIYSLGVVLYEMLIGQVPFHADSQVGVAMKHVNEELPDVQRRRPEVSAAVGAGGRAGDGEGPGRALPDDRRDDRRPRDRARGRGGAGRVDHRRGDQRARRGAAAEAQALRPGALVLGGDRRSCVLVGGGALLAVQLISGGGIGGGGAQQRQGRARSRSPRRTDYDPQGDGEEVGSKVELAVDGDPTGTAWETEHYDSATFEAPRPGPTRASASTSPPSSPATPSENDRAHPHAGLGRRGLRRRRPARPATSPAGANRSGEASEAGETAGDRPRRPPALDRTSCSGSPRPRRRATRTAATRSRSATSSCSTEPAAQNSCERALAWRSTASSTRRSQRSG